jgi:hypothetical protein
MNEGMSDVMVVDQEGEVEDGLFYRLCHPK